jgi:hypothetical protein
MLLVIAMFFVIIASYALLLGVVNFSERVIAKPLAAPVSGEPASNVKNGAESPLAI